MNGDDIKKLLERYGTSLEETRKLVPELTEAVRRKRAVKPPALPQAPQFFTAQEAKGLGIELDEGWMLKVTPGRNGAEPSFSYISPEKWEITQDETYISPEGQQFSKWEIYHELFPPELPPESLLAPTPEEVGKWAGREITAEEYEMYMARGIMPTAPRLDVEQIFGKVFPERDIEGVLAYAEAQPEAFYTDILEIGRTAETEDLLKTMFPDITSEQLEEFFAPMAVVPLTELAKEQWKATPWLAPPAEWEEAVKGFPGFMDIMQWLAPTKLGAAIGVAGAYIEKYAGRPWELAILEAKTRLLPEHTELQRQTLDMLDTAYSKYGWTAIFSEEVSDAWYLAWERGGGPEWGREFYEWTNPIYWVPIGGAFGKAAQFTSKIPIIGRVMRGTAAGVQAVERGITYPVAKPVEWGVARVGAKLSKSLANKLIKQSERLILPLEEDLATFETRMLDQLLKPNWMTRTLQLASKIPPVKGVIERTLGRNILVKRQGQAVEEVVARGSIIHTQWLGMGQNAKNATTWTLRSIEDNPIKLFGFNKQAFSSKMAGRLLPEYQAEVKLAGSLEHVFTKPEMYNWSGVGRWLPDEQVYSGLKYVTAVHDINTEVLNLLKKVEVAPEHVVDDWIHRVVLQEGERKPLGRAIGKKMPYERHRKFETMAEGIDWFMSHPELQAHYANNPELLVSSYIAEAFKKVADARFMKYIEPFGILPAERLAERFPEIIERAVLTQTELADAARFHSAINRAIRGEKLPELTLRAMETRFPELGRKFRALVQEPIAAEKQLRELLAQNEKVIKDLTAKLKKAEAIDIEAIRAEAVRVGIPDDQKLTEAFRLMDYEDRLAFRSTMDTQLDDISRMLYEQDVELRSIREFLKTDPVAIYHGTIRGKRVPLTAVLKKGQFPETFSVEEARMLMMGKQPKTVIKGRVPRAVVVDELADHFKMGEQQLIDHIEFIRVQRETAQDIVELVRFGSARQTEIKRMLGILDNVDTTATYVPKPEIRPVEAVPEITAEVSPDIARDILKTKEVWQLKQGDYEWLRESLWREQWIKRGRPVSYGITSADAGIARFKKYDKVHQQAVAKALSEGKTVPQEVLVGYPELVARIPKAEIGMPEAGVQKDIFGYETPVFPKGKGQVTQISMEEYNRLMELRKVADLPGEPPNIAIKPKIEGVKGLEAEETITIYHSTIERNLAGIRAEGLKTPSGVMASKWYMVTDSLEGARLYATGEKPIIIRYQIPKSEFNKYFWPGAHSKTYGTQYGLREPLPSQYIAAADVPSAQAALEPSRVAAFEAQRVSYDLPPIKPVAERKAALESLRNEAKSLVEARKAPFWQARAERALRMEQVRQPGIGEGYIMQPFAGGRIYDQAFIDSFNRFFGHERGIPGMNITADAAGILRITKAALDFSAPAIQGLPSWGLAHAQLLFNPPVGLRLIGAWYKAFFMHIGAFFDRGIVANYMAKNKPLIDQMVSLGGSIRTIDYFATLGAEKGLGGFAARIMRNMPLQPYLRAETSFFGFGQIVRTEFARVFLPKAIQRNQEFQLMRFLDRMTGIADSRMMGVPLSTRQLEQTFVWFAPNYTRACLGLLADIFRGGLEGNMAKQALGGLITAGAAMYMGVKYAISTLEGKSDEQAWEDIEEGFCVYTDPITGEVEWKPSARFMSLQIGNYYFGFGGFWYGLLRLAGNVMACLNEVGEKEKIDLVRIMKHGSFNKRDNPFIYWWFSRSSPFFGTGFELAAGRDFLGYPIETPDDYAKYLVTRFEPIWAEQGLNWMLPGMARDNEIPEGMARKAVIPAELFGLRTFPEGTWVSFYDKVNEYIRRIPLDELDDKQKEAWQEGKLEWRHLTEIQKANLLSRYPELQELYGEAQADSAVRQSPHWEAWQGRMNEERDIYYKRIGDLTDQLLRGDIDTREYREKAGEAGQNYGSILESIERDPNYSEIYDFFDKKEAEGDRYGFRDDLALAEFQSTILYTEDLIDSKGDYNWDERDRRIDAFIDKWGQDTFDRIQQYLQEKKGLKELSEVWIRKSSDTEKLGRSYWRLPYKPITEMDEDDEVEGNIPAEYYALWKQYQGLETDAEREEFIASHPDLARDWRAEYRKGNPEDDARLAIWGYGGKLQTREAYDLVSQWGRELGIPLEQMGLGLPPRSLIDQYFDYAELTTTYSGNAAEARLYRLENPDWNAWGQENWGWKEVDQQIEVLRISVQYRDMDKEYDAIKLEDATEQREARDKYLEGHLEYAKARRQRDAYNLGFPDNLIDNYVEYYDLPEKGSWRERYLLENKDFYQAMMELRDIQPIEPDKVKPQQYDEIYQEWEELFEQYDNVTGTASQREEARDKILKDNPEFATARQRWMAYGKGFPELLIEDYVSYYSIKKPEDYEYNWYEDDWFLLEHPEFYKVCLELLGWQPKNFTKVPTREVFDLYKTYLGLPSGQPRLDFRVKHPDLDAWLVRTRGYKAASDRGKKEAEMTPWEEFEWVKRFKEKFKEE